MKLPSSIYEKLNLENVMSISDNMPLFINRNYFSAQDSMLEYFFQCSRRLVWSWYDFRRICLNYYPGCFMTLQMREIVDNIFLNCIKLLQLFANDYIIFESSLKPIRFIYHKSFVFAMEVGLKSCRWNKAYTLRSEQVFRQRYGDSCPI